MKYGAAELPLKLSDRVCTCYRRSLWHEKLVLSAHDSPILCGASGSCSAEFAGEVQHLFSFVARRQLVLPDGTFRSNHGKGIANDPYYESLVFVGVITSLRSVF